MSVLLLSDEISDKVSSVRLRLVFILAIKALQREDKFKQIILMRPDEKDLHLLPHSEKGFNLRSLFEKSLDLR